jgi:hypothetical protein
MGLFGAAFAWLIRKKHGISPPNAARWTRVSRPPAHHLSGICTALVRIERSGPRAALAYLSRAFVTRAPKRGLKLTKTTVDLVILFKTTSTVQRFDGQHRACLGPWYVETGCK